MFLFLSTVLSLWITIFDVIYYIMLMLILNLIKAIKYEMNFKVKYYLYDYYVKICSIITHQSFQNILNFNSLGIFELF